MLARACPPEAWRAWVGFEPTTPGSKVRDPPAELAARRDQGPRAGMRNGLAVDQASPDDLPEKQDTPHRRLVTYVVYI